MSHGEIKAGDIVRVVQRGRFNGAVGPVKSVFDLCVDKHKGDYERGAGVKIDGRFYQFELTELVVVDAVTRLGELAKEP